MPIQSLQEKIKALDTPELHKQSQLTAAQLSTCLYRAEQGDQAVFNLKQVRIINESFKIMINELFFRYSI